MRILHFLYFAILFPFSYLFSQTNQFKIHNPCSFSISLPASFQFSNMTERPSADYCDYEVLFKEKGVSLQVHSLLNSRFETTDVNELFVEAKKNIGASITYQFKTDRFYVLSGTKAGNIFYRKRYIGNNYISDLEIEYSPTQKNVIEKYIGKIAGSFKCD